MPPPKRASKMMRLLDKAASWVGLATRNKGPTYFVNSLYTNDKFANTSSNEQQETDARYSYGDLDATTSAQVDVAIPARVNVAINPRYAHEADKVKGLKPNELYESSDFDEREGLNDNPLYESSDFDEREGLNDNPLYESSKLEGYNQMEGAYATNHDSMPNAAVYSEVGAANEYAQIDDNPARSRATGASSRIGNPHVACEQQQYNEMAELYNANVAGPRLDTEIQNRPPTEVSSDPVYHLAKNEFAEETKASNTSSQSVNKSHYDNVVPLSDDPETNSMPRPATR